jgi:hypothetical protein
LDWQHTLAESLCGDQACPVPSTHDKLSEAHYFIHEMIAKYHFLHEFRYSLSAFFQAARNVTFFLQKELGQAEGFEDWYAPLQVRMGNDENLKLLNDKRVETAHIKSLEVASQMFLGHFKYGKPHGGLLMPMSPMSYSMDVFMFGRESSHLWVHPHRMWDGEEFGIRRKWMLEEIKDKELVEFCVSCWETIGEVVGTAHSWRGFQFSPIAKCNGHQGYRDVCESDIFEDVAKAWNGEPTERVTAKEQSLEFLAHPHEDSKVHFVLDASATSTGWVGRPRGHWNPEYASFLVYDINKAVVSENTAVFFKGANAIIERLPPSHSEE